MTASTSPLTARLGAAAYVLWGLMHVGLATTMMATGLDAGLNGDELEAESLMFFACATVLGTAAIVVAVTLNWRNSTLGYWLNALLVVPVDVALLVVLVRAGHIDVVGGSAGPVVAAVALALSTAGQLARRSTGTIAT